ncbi:hypothetical protein NUW58_g5840 [Xylaria curta]|uniref:Uncharacterized protein n=1 Tax=Xylaria curta TaxID=42375 RepID=A0ACC1NZP6_9PEZI|nr:hypothetical protein NUW58_g5840 [Xylaria curta]
MSTDIPGADLWAGYISGAVSIILGNSMDVKKVQLQAGYPQSAAAAPSRPGQSPASASSLSKYLPPRSSLLAGSLAPVLGNGALTAILMGSYTRTEDALNRLFLSGSLPGSPNGAMSGLDLERFTFCEGDGGEVHGHSRTLTDPISLGDQCDEGKPQCKRCSSFGVLCNFMSNVPDLQPVAADIGRPLAVRRKAQLQPPVANAVWTSDASTCYQLNAKCQDFITRYLGRSLITPDDPNMRQVNDKLLKLAFAYPFLMHASLAVALTYDRHLNSSSSCRRTLEECYHWSQSTILLNRRLKEPIKAQDKDPIWGTAAALAMLTFSSPDACEPEESWPLKPSDSTDFDWLTMSKGKMALWHTVNPLRPDSLFSVMAATYAQMYSPFPERGVDGIPGPIATACHLEMSSTAQSNPYFDAAHAVSQILSVPDCEVRTGQTQLFTRTIHGGFKGLLQARDPIALLLLYLWLSSQEGLSPIDGVSEAFRVLEFLTAIIVTEKWVNYSPGDPEDLYGP